MRLHAILESALKHAEMIHIEHGSMLIVYGDTVLAVKHASLELRYQLGESSMLDQFKTKTNLGKLYEHLGKTMRGFKVIPTMHGEIWEKIK